MSEHSWNEDDEGEEQVVPCPYCKHLIYEDSPRCPYCEQYITDEETAPTRKPWWIIVGVLLVFYIVYRWVTG